MAAAAAQLGLRFAYWMAAAAAQLTLRLLDGGNSSSANTSPIGWQQQLSYHVAFWWRQQMLSALGPAYRMAPAMLSSHMALPIGWRQQWLSSRGPAHWMAPAVAQLTWPCALDGASSCSVHMALPIGWRQQDPHVGQLAPSDILDIHMPHTGPLSDDPSHRHVIDIHALGSPPRLDL